MQSRCAGTGGYPAPGEEVAGIDMEEAELVKGDDG